MSSSKPVTETVTLRLRPGVDLDSVYAGRDVEPGTAAHELVKLGNSIKAQQGAIRQFWGTQVEDPETFVWTIDWESFEHHASFMNSPAYKDFMASAAQVWDFAAAPPMMTHTAFTSNATAAREAPVTEVAYFMVPKAGGEETKTQLEDATMPLFKAASDVGKCTSFAVGWIFEDQPHPQIADGQASALQALLGWTDVEAHNAFRAAPEFASTIAPVREQMLPPSPGKSMFHVKFHAVA